MASVLSAPPGPIPQPTNASLSAAPGGALWALIAYAYLYRSTDRGGSWEQRPLPPSVGGGIEIAFVNDLEGWFLDDASPETQCNPQAVTI